MRGNGAKLTGCGVRAVAVSDEGEGLPKGMIGRRVAGCVEVKRELVQITQVNV